MRWHCSASPISSGTELQRIFTLTKEQEIDEFRRRISTLEYQSYLERL